VHLHGFLDILIWETRKKIDANGKSMTPLLEKAFAKAAALPDSIQDQLAEQLGEEIAGESAWGRALADSQEFLEALAAKARRDAYEQGKTVKKGFDEL
jgi:hypothetical protein